jgi:uncharacterized membrane protein
VAEDVEGGAADRLIFFSDAVVAIALTLLALELPVPTGSSAREFWRSVGSHFDAYLAFLISFIVISQHWFAHHRVFRYLKRGDDRLRGLNMLWLLTIVLMPFATNVLSSEENDATAKYRWAFYAALQLVAFLLFRQMIVHMLGHGLVVADVPHHLEERTNWRAAGVVLGFGLSIPLFFLTRFAWLLWIIGPVASATYERRRTKRAAASGQAPS